jgi:hypothetical protein
LWLRSGNFGDTDLIVRFTSSSKPTLVNPHVSSFVAESKDPRWAARGSPGREDRIAAAQAKRDRKNAKRAPRRASNGDGNVRPDDGLIISCLDDTWRTPPAVHRLLESRGAVADIAYALERLARAGKIEAKHEAAMTGMAGPPVLSVSYYRKLQKWPKSSSVGKLPTTVTDSRQQPARKKPAPPPRPRPATNHRLGENKRHAPLRRAVDMAPKSKTRRREPASASTYRQANQTRAAPTATMAAP